MDKEEFNKIKKILESDEFINSVVANINNRDKKLIEIANKNFPDHQGHNKQIKEYNYFGAMIVNIELDCSCGEVIVVTREML